MKKPANEKLPELGWGEGSWGFDHARNKVTLRHRWNGKQHIERGLTAEACLLARDRRRRDLDLESTLAGDGTLAGLLAAYVEFRSKGKAPGTARNYRWAANHLLRLLGEDVRLLDLTVKAVEEMLATLLDEGLGRSAFLKVRGTLNKALNFGVRRDLLPASHRERLRSAESPELPPKTNNARWFDLEDYMAARAHLVTQGGTRNAMFLTSLLCGLRPGECLGLRWDRVDLDAREIHVEGTVQRHGINRGKFTTRLKTDHRHAKAHRSVPMPTDLVRVLTELKANAKVSDRPVPQVVGPPLRTDSFVFVEDRGLCQGRLMTDDAQHRHALIIAADVGVRRVNPNGYRHTFASIYRLNGFSYEALAELMGHQDTTMLIQTYGHPLKGSTPIDADFYTSVPQT